MDKGQQNSSKFYQSCILMKIQVEVRENRRLRMYRMRHQWQEIISLTFWESVAGSLQDVWCVLMLSTLQYYW